ncbi:MAG TPA: substrate-binding domain-containing protein [Clostridiaceae bacterium]|nr:substrate-binding domain-containing protein [Clostridiaceae bacterium]
MTEFKTIGKSKQFYDFLKSEILSGEYKPNDKFPSIRELAQKYNISTVTVNSVISSLVAEGYLYVEQGKGTFVKEVKNDRRKGKKMIGVMFFDFRLENNIEATMFNSIQENLKDDYYLIPYNTYDDVQNFYKGLRGFTDLEVDGLILVPPASEAYDQDIVRSLIPKNIPVVFINRKISSVPADFLGMDFETATYIAVKHILQQGRQNVLLIRYSSPSISENMTRGYIKAYKELGVPVDTNLIIDWPKINDGIDNRFKEKYTNILKKKQYVNGLVASDILIYKYRKSLHEANREVPKDLSIVSINDTVYSRFMEPPLTTVPFPSAEIGQKAVKIIIDRIEGKKYEYIHEYIVKDLIKRKS